MVHSIGSGVATWGELCATVPCDPGATPADTPVRKIITTPPMANTPTGNSGLKDLGFTKLVKRDDGVYENVTRSGAEKRYMRTDDPSSMPDFKRKLGD